jgi:hypothetical protein
MQEVASVAVVVVDLSRRSSVSMAGFHNIEERHSIGLWRCIAIAWGILLSGSQLPLENYRL